MKQIPVKVNYVNEVDASEFNSISFELQNIVSDSGQSLSESDQHQASKAAAIYAGNGDYYSDTGTATAYQLDPVGGKKSPPNYYLGQRVRFIATNTNTGIATARIGTLTPKTIKDADGNDLIEGDILINKQIEMFYDGTYFVIFATGVGSSEFVTGDVKTSIRPTAQAGWVIMNDGTIGDALSGGTTRANADTKELFTLLWEQIIDTWCPVSGGRGASAAIDFAAHKTITLPRALGRALATAGTGAGLPSRSLGEYLGEVAHQQSVTELAKHNHYHPGIPTYVGEVPDGHLFGGGGYGISFGFADAGSNTPFNIMQPSLFLNLFIKL